MDVFLLLLLPIFTLISACASLQVLVHFQMPEDEGFKNSWICKIALILSLTLSGAITMLLPIDVKNTAENGGLNMEIVWPAAFILMVVFALVVNPLAMLLYETEGDVAMNPRRRLRAMLIQGTILTLGLVAIIGVTYLLLSKASVPCNSVDQKAEKPTPGICKDNLNGTFRTRTAFHIYIIAVVSFIGWFLFAIFGGCGIAAIPYMLMRASMRRPPSAIRDADYRNHRDVLARAASSLQVRSEKLKREETKLDTLREFTKKRKEASLKRDFNKFKADVHMLEDAFSHAHSAVNRSRGENSGLIRVGKLALGIISMILSMLWLLHVVLFMVARKKGTGQSVAWRMFATEAHYLDFYRFFFDNKVFLYMMIISSVIGFIMLTVNGRVKRTSLYLDKSAEKRIRELASLSIGAG
ncbi:hypothetical protein FOZ60_005963 [Perkinsus olseni]|uniref:Uncharacterized protein n=1 Tax=Perkinsus olseni TaxID=32597 RepID=A0A7J6NPX4_PEROL|nr:hypothetical protein FOZ60_005963 [Perkinsus olseni]